MSSSEFGRRITLGNLLFECASKYGSRPFLTIVESGTSISYINFERHVNRLAHGLQSRFGNRDQYVAIMLENRLEYLALSYALKITRQVEVRLNVRFAARL